MDAISALMIVTHTNLISMSNKKNVHVVPNPYGGWDVKRELAERASFHFDTQAEAETKGRELARADKVEFLLHGRDGKIRLRDGYGNDPFPPRG